MNFSTPVYQYPVPGNPPDTGTFDYPAFNTEWTPVLVGLLDSLKNADLWDSPPTDLLPQIDELINRLLTMTPPVTVDYPDSVTIAGGARRKKTGSAVALTVNTSMVWGLYWYQNAPAINDETSLFVGLAQGNYKLHIIGLKSASSGIVETFMDGNSLGTNDLYSAANVYNVETIVLVNHVLRGGHEFSFKVGSKNASSNNYAFAVTFMFFEWVSIYLP